MIILSASQLDHAEVIAVKLRGTRRISFAPSRNIIAIACASRACSSYVFNDFDSLPSMNEDGTWVANQHFCVDPLLSLR